jgi:hypothetical protein
MEKFLGKYDFKDAKGYGAITPEGVFRPITFDAEDRIVIEGNSLLEEERLAELAETQAWELYFSQLKNTPPKRGRPKGSKTKRFI